MYVLSTDKTPAPGKIGTDGKYIYGTTSVDVEQLGYDGTEEEPSTNNGDPIDVVLPEPEPVEPVEPWMDEGEQGAFFESSWTGNIRAHVWTSGGSVTGAWPGQTCQNLGNGVWKWHYDGSKNLENNGAQIIFHNNQGSQTKDLKFVNGGYYNSNGELVKVIEGAGEIPEDPVLPEVTVNWNIYFDNTSSAWSSVSAYFWDKGNGNKRYLGEWPGTMMTQSTEDENMWSISFTTTDAIVTPMIIFNNAGAGKQTSDFTAENYGVYTSAGFDHSGVADVKAGNLVVTVSNGVIYVESPVECDVDVISASGINFRNHLKAGHNAIGGLARGVYMVAGKKVVL